jgi:hypothetical protein
MYVRTIYCEGSDTVEFVKLNGNAPGFSHRVVINGVAVDWLGSHVRPSKTAAKFFLGKFKCSTAQSVAGQ